MGTTRTFSDMLNEYLPNELLKEELIKRDYLLSKIEKDNSWKGGNLVVPFKAAGASTIVSAALADSSNVSEDKFVRGGVSAHKEVWGTLLFNHRDLMEHDMVSEQNFLKILPDAIESFMDNMKEVVSLNLLNSAWFAKLTVAASANDGLITVDHPERFKIGQEVKIVDGSSDITGFVGGINMNTKVITLWTTRAGTTVLDFSGAEALDVAAKCYNRGFDSSAFSSLRGALLSAANGGDATLYGQTKASYPYLQAINVDGSTITAVNIMQKIFDALTTIRQFGKGNPTDVVMSYKNFGSCLKVVEASKGGFNVSPGSQKASQYGWTELEVGSVTRGGLKLVGVQEMDDDIIHFIDWRALKFYSNGFFQKRKSPEGKEFFEVRATTGYSYLLDICLFGEMVVLRPSYCGILHGISY